MGNNHSALGIGKLLNLHFYITSYYDEVIKEETDRRNIEMSVDYAYKIRKEVKKHMPKDCRYVIGVSGGSDSIALAYAMKDEGYDFVAVIVDHQLQEDSAQFSESARSMLSSYGIESIIHKVDVPVTNTGVEDAARQVRYEALFSHGEHVVTGHTKSDQAETVLLGLKQGSGSSAIAGMRIVSKNTKGFIYRPMLEHITKSDTQKACDQYGVKYWNDPHNECDDYTRVRVRNNVLPVMSDQLGVDMIDKLATTAFMVQKERDFIQRFVDEAYTQCVAGDVIDVSVLSTHDPLIVSNVVARFIKTHAGCIKKSWVDSACTLVFDFTGGKVVQVRNGQLVFRDKKITWLAD